MNSMTNFDDEVSVDRFLNSVLRPRLAADSVTDMPTFKDLGLEDAKKVAVSCQKQRSMYENKQTEVAVVG